MPPNVRPPSKRRYQHFCPAARALETIGERWSLLIVRDLLDKAVVDRNGREMGRVDGIVLELRTNEPPRLSQVLIGASVLGARVNVAFGRWVHGVEHGVGLGDERPIQIDFAHIDEIGDKVKVDLAVGDTGADSLEQRVRRWVLKIPGSQ